MYRKIIKCLDVKSVKWTYRFEQRPLYLDQELVCLPAVFNGHCLNSTRAKSYLNEVLPAGFYGIYCFWPGAQQLVVVQYVYYVNSIYLCLWSPTGIIC